MSVIADFYISSDSDATAYDADQSLPESDRAQHKAITPLELSTLQSILENCEWDVEMMDNFPCVLERDGGERLIHLVPDAFAERLIAADSETFRKAAKTWAETEELQWDPSETEAVMRDIVRLARKARTDGKSLYLWNCV